MSNRLKAGVIGTGFIGPIHVEAIRRTNLGEVVAISGSNHASAQKRADEYGIPKAYGDYRDLIEDSEIDVVHICSTNNLHFEMAKAALLAGKHVVCEKPLTVNQQEADELIQLGDETGLIHAVHFNVRYYPLVREARELVATGSIGNIFAIQGSYLQDWLYYDTDYSWRLEPEQSGESRAIADIGSHWLDLIEHISQCRVTEVLADFATFHKNRKRPLKQVETWSNKLLTLNDYETVPIHTEDYASVLLHFDDGGHGIFTVNQMAAGHKNRVFYEINGSKSSLIWDSERPNELVIGHRDRANEVLLRDPSLMHEASREIVSYPGGHNEGFADTSKQLFKEVYQYIMKGDMHKNIPPKFPTFHDGGREVKLCEAIVKSARSGAWTSV